MPNPMLSRTVSWRCEPCGVEERFEQHVIRPRCWVCDQLMLHGPHPGWALNSQTSMFVSRVWVQQHTDERRSA